MTYQKPPVLFFRLDNFQIVNNFFGTYSPIYSIEEKRRRRCDWFLLSSFFLSFFLHSGCCSLAWLAVSQSVSRTIFSICDVRNKKKKITHFFSNIFWLPKSCITLLMPFLAWMQLASSAICTLPWYITNACLVHCAIIPKYLYRQPTSKEGVMVDLFC